MGIDASVAVVRECLPVDMVLAAVGEAFPVGHVAVLISDETSLPHAAARSLGAVTAASLWSPLEAEGAFMQFVLALSRRSKTGACGITVADHACVSSFLVAQDGRVADAGHAEGDAYLTLPAAALQRAFSVPLGLTADETLVLTDSLLSPVSGFRLLDGHFVGPLTKEDALAIQEGDGAFTDFECILGM